MLDRSSRRRFSIGRRRLTVIAAAAILAAAVFSGAGLAQRLSTDNVSTAALSQPALLDTGVRQMPGITDLGSVSQPAYDSSGSVSSDDVSSIASEVSSAIVNITVKNEYTLSEGSATGIVLTADGLVLTNNHVIQGATSISAVDVGNGQTYSATVVGYDSSFDIALIQLEDASGLTTADIGDSSELVVGDTVVGVGNAGGDGGTPDAVGGVVVALDQQIVVSDSSSGTLERLTGLIKTDADVQSGDSGGPLVDADGKVIGVMTAASSSAYSSDTDGFAVPIDTAMAIVAQIRSGESSSTVHIGTTAFLGVVTTSSGSTGESEFGQGGYGPQQGGYGQGGYGSGDFGEPSGSSSTGVAISGVVSGTPADEIGLAAGDIITAVDGETVGSASDLSDLIGAHHPGDKATITWTDASGTQHSKAVQLIAGPAG